MDAKKVVIRVLDFVKKEIIKPKNEKEKTKIPNNRIILSL